MPAHDTECGARATLTRFPIHFSNSQFSRRRAPSPVFFVEAPGRPVFPSPLRIRGDGAPGGAAVVGSISASPCEMRKRLPARHPNIFQCPGSFADVFFRSSQCRKRNSCAGPRFPVWRCRLDRSSLPRMAPCWVASDVRACRQAAKHRSRQPAPGRRLVLATGRSPGAARVLGRSVRLPPAGAASCSIIRRLMMTPLDRAGRHSEYYPIGIKSRARIADLSPQPIESGVWRRRAAMT